MFWLLLALTLVATLLSLMVGRFSISLLTILRIVVSRFLDIKPDWQPVAEVAIMQVRLPRVGVGLLVGAALAVGGTVYQGVFRNPLVSPFVLGVSAGAGFGAALAILLNGSGLTIQLSAFTFAVVAVITTALLGRIYKANQTIVLVLAGIIVGSVFTALLGLLKYMADTENRLPAIEYWLLGSLSATRTPLLWGLLLVDAPAFVLLFLLRWRLNLLALGDETARALGVRVGFERLIQLCLATVLASSAVAACGLVGWIGLVVPHLGRLLVGADHDRLIPASLLLGASVLLLSDTVARSISSAEVPLGIVTALLGAPVFAVLLGRGERAWS